jgi:hypothetical protein
LFVFFSFVAVEGGTYYHICAVPIQELEIHPKKENEIWSRYVYAAAYRLSLSPSLEDLLITSDVPSQANLEAHSEKK